MTFAAYQNFIYAWMLLGLAVFIYLCFKPAPYGRHVDKDWGPTIPNKWGWFIMETTVLVALFARLWPFADWVSLPSVVMISLFCLHYINRSWIFPFSIKTSGKRMPLLTVGSAVLFNTINGSLLGIWFSRFAHYTDTWMKQPLFLVGLMLFVGGFGINLWADGKLFALRKNGDTGYYIPRGGLYELISSPNLFGEIIEWTGFALLTWSLPALAFLVWTLANLVPRALANQRWYKARFSDYPASRKILFPYIW
jgi:3-oxo-5-alpha-steroid 4-dehydrogenase 1